MLIAQHLLCGELNASDAPLSLTISQFQSKNIIFTKFQFVTPYICGSGFTFRAIICSDKSIPLAHDPSLLFSRRSFESSFVETESSFDFSFRSAKKNISPKSARS